jgi:hypothetical protein
MSKLDKLYDKALRAVVPRKKTDQWGNVRHAIRMIHPGYYGREDGSAEAVRYMAGEASWHGWIVRSTTQMNSMSDPISTKVEALEQLRIWK